MNVLISGVAIALIVTAVVWLVLVAKQKSRATESGDDTTNYRAAGPLLTPAERSFYGVLLSTVDDTVNVFAKVRVADVILPAKGQSKGSWQRAFNRVSAKHFDFVLCRADDLRVLCAIELNDRSHKAASRQQRDEFLREACGSAGVPLVQVAAKQGYVVSEVRAMVESQVGSIGEALLYRRIKNKGGISHEAGQAADCLDGTGGRAQ